MIRSKRLQAYIITDHTDFVGWKVIGDLIPTSKTTGNGEPIFVIELERDAYPEIRRKAYTTARLIPLSVTRYYWKNPNNE